MARMHCTQPFGMEGLHRTLFQGTAQELHPPLPVGQERALLIRN